MRCTTPANDGRRGEIRTHVVSLPGRVPEASRLPSDVLVLPRRIELRSLVFQTSVITGPTQAAINGGDGGSRTLNFGVQNRCVPASTTSPDYWGGIGELTSCFVSHRHAPKPRAQPRHKLLEHLQ